MTRRKPPPPGLKHMVAPVDDGGIRYRCLDCGQGWAAFPDSLGGCPGLPPGTKRSVKGDTQMLNTIQVGQIHRISHTEVFNSDKAGVTQTLTLTVNAPRSTVDAVLQLAQQGAPVQLAVGTLQERMPLRAEKGQPDPPAADPKASTTPRSKAKAKPETAGGGAATTPKSAGSGQDVRPQEEKAD